MNKSRLNQILTFIIAIIGIMLLLLGNELNISLLTLLSVIVLLFGFIFMIITSRSIFGGWEP
jgi:hypothetical protein